MLWSRLISLLLILVVPSAFALNRKEIEAKLCDGILGLTAASAKPGEVPKFLREQGFGVRGFLGGYPLGDMKGTEIFDDLNIILWGHSFAVKKSIDEARKHDAQFFGLDKIMYLISDVDVSDLNDKTPKRIVQGRFATVFEDAHLVYWDDSEDMLLKNGAPAKFVEVDKEIAARLLVKETMEYFTLDDRGPRFAQDGWTYPVMRGEMTYDKVFGSDSSSITKIIRKSKGLERQGYTFTFNQDPQECLNAARDQMRVSKGEDGVKRLVEKNSRYFIQPDLYRRTQQAIARGDVVTSEVRDPQGRLIAGVLGFRSGNIFELDTIFYTFDELSRDASGKITWDMKSSHLDEAKMAVVAILKRLHEYGIDVIDVGMVTVFTKSMKGEYVLPEQFAADTAHLKSSPKIVVDFTTPWKPY